MIFGYDYQTVERSLTEVTAADPGLPRGVRGRATKDIIPQARERQVISQANVVGVGVLDAQRDSGFGDGVHEPHGHRQVQAAASTTAAGCASTTRRSTAQWLIKYITPI